MSGPRYIGAAEIDAKLGYAELADAISTMLVAAPHTPLRQQHPLGDGDTLLLMPAWRDGEAGALGVKLVTVMPGNRARGIPTVNAIYLLFDRVSGVPHAVIDGEALTLRRTAAASLLAARHLARQNAAKLLVIGTGRLAPCLARAHCSGRTIGQLRIWGRRREAAQALAHTLRDEGLPAHAVEDLQRAVSDADIISCATTAIAPLVEGAWLSAGSHVDLVGGFRRGMREADDATIARSRIYVDTYAGALAEADDILEPLERGVIARDAIVGELSELVSGSVPGRTSDTEITLFKSVGTALEDLAAAQLLLARA